MVDPAISNRFDRNIARVAHLVTVYEGLSGPGQGRRPVYSTDILRAATVLLHASLEDALRSLELEVLPKASKEEIDKVPLKGLGIFAQKFFLGELVAHRGKSVADVLTESVTEFLGTRSYNKVSEVDAAIRRVGVDPGALEHLYPSLEEMISRRHHIVHQADRHDVPGHDHHRAKSIGLTMIRRWITTVETLINMVFDAFVP